MPRDASATLAIQRRAITRRLMDARGRQATDWLFEQVEAYPAGDYHPPLRPPRSGDYVRKFLACELAGAAVAGGMSGEPTTFTLSDGDDCTRVIVDDGDDGIEQICHALFVKRTRGHLLCFWRGARVAFHIILARWSQGLVARGYTIQPLAAGTTIKALIVRRGKQSWWLCDVAAMTGLSDFTQAEFVAAYLGGAPTPREPVAALWRALDGFQRWSLATFHAALRPTIGGAAMRAASRHIDERAWVWRPSPLLATMAREGGGFRGGYAVASRFVGRAWRADLNKAYTAALAEPLPARTALTLLRGGGEQRPGLFLCRLRGPGALPVYIAHFTGWTSGFERDYWNGAECWTVLPSSEFAGLRALGFRPEPLWGFVHVRSFDLGAHARAVERAALAAPRGTPHHVAAKLMGNAVYGKLAESPDRTDIVYSAGRPGPDWHPHLNAYGDETPFLWEGQTTSHRPHQHVDIAATITGRVRGWLYEGIAAVRAAGGLVVHADTDGFLSTIDPSAALGSDPNRLGAWRVSQGPEQAVVWGSKGYSFGTDVRVAGIAGLTPEQAAMVAEGMTVPVEMIQTSAPWSGRSPSERITRRVRARG